MSNDYRAERRLKRESLQRQYGHAGDPATLDAWDARDAVRECHYERLTSDGDDMADAIIGTKSSDALGEFLERIRAGESLTWDDVCATFQAAIRCDFDGRFEP